MEGLHLEEDGGFSLSRTTMNAGLDQMPTEPMDDMVDEEGADTGQEQDGVTMYTSSEEEDLSGETLDSICLDASGTSIEEHCRY